MFATGLTIPPRVSARQVEIGLAGSFFLAWISNQHIQANRSNSSRSFPNAAAQSIEITVVDAPSVIRTKNSRSRAACFAKGQQHPPPRFGGVGFQQYF